MHLKWKIDEINEQISNLHYGGRPDLFCVGFEGIVFNSFESIWKRKEQLCKIPRLFKTTKKKTNVLASWAKGIWLDGWWMEEGKVQQSDFTQLYMVAYVSSIIVWNGCISAVAHITLVKVLLDSHLRYYER